MEAKPITIDVIMDDKTFRRFSVFDIIHIKKLWKSPAIFAGILVFCALICFIFRERAQSAVLLGSVLLIVGLGLPVIYFRVFFSSVNMQSRNYKLAIPRRVYSLVLSADEINISNPSGQKASYKWDDVYGAYRVRACSYLYITAAKAFILPDAQISGGPDALWALFERTLPKDKLRGRRK